MVSDPLIVERIADLRDRIAVWEEYLNANVSIRNWHGVEDAARDIRDFEAAIAALEWARHAE